MNTKAPKSARLGTDSVFKNNWIHIHHIDLHPQIQNTVGKIWERRVQCLDKCGIVFMGQSLWIDKNPGLEGKSNINIVLSSEISHRPLITSS